MTNYLPIGTGFHAAYRELETRMRTLAESEGDVFLPNPEPPGPVDYVFICMEPSLRGWARSPVDPRAKVEAGFRNFVSSIEDFILHFSIRHYLCGPTQRYHITDLAKGAMTVRRARVDRTQRYDRWCPLLLEELDLVATSGAQVFAVGRDVAKHLWQRSFPRLFTRVILWEGKSTSNSDIGGMAGAKDCRGWHWRSLCVIPIRLHAG